MSPEHVFYLLGCVTFSAVYFVVWLLMRFVIGPSIDKYDRGHK